jgi:hypothetical protein
MKLLTNHALIKRNRSVGMAAALLAPVLMTIGAFVNPAGQGGFLLTLGLVLLALILFLVGLALRRFGLGAENRLAEALRKLDDSYTLFNFVSPAAHLLVGPAGIWILVPRYVRGTLVYNPRRRRWQVRRDRPADRLLGPIFGGLGRPDYDLAADADALDRFLHKRWTRPNPPHVDAAIVVINDEGAADAAAAPVPTLHISKLRAFLREREGKGQMKPAALREIAALFEPPA